MNDVGEEGSARLAKKSSLRLELKSPKQVNKISELMYFSASAFMAEKNVCFSSVRSSRYQEAMFELCEVCGTQMFRSLMTVLSSNINSTKL